MPELVSVTDSIVKEVDVDLQREESNGEELRSSEDVVRQWHSAKAVLLLLREELQQMRVFIGGLHIPGIQSADFNDLSSGAGSVERRAQRGPSRLDDVDEALRVVCDRLDALAIVIDVVLDDRAAETFNTDSYQESGRVVGSAAISSGAPDLTTRVEDAGGEKVALGTENRQLLFDQLVDMMRQLDETDVVRHLRSPHYEAPLNSHCQMQRMQRIQSNEYSEELTDTDRVSDSTEANNSSNESSDATCHASSPSSASPNARHHQSVCEKISTSNASNANEAQPRSSSNVTAEESKPAKSEIGMGSKAHAKLSQSTGDFLCEEQSYKSAMGLFCDEQSLLQLQQRTNLMLHHELVQLSDDNRRLQGVISDLETSLDWKNNEVVILRNRLDHARRLLDEQVEEFRCVFRAVTRESDEELRRLDVENSKLRSALTNRDNSDGFSTEEPTEKELPGDNTSAHGHETCPVFIREHSELLQTDDVLTKGRRNGISREDEVVCPHGFYDESCPDYMKLDKFIQAQESQLVLDCRGSDAHLLVPVHYVEDLWSEIDALKKTVFEQGRYLVTPNGDERERCVPGMDLNDSGVVATRGDSIVDDGDREMNGLELTEHLPLFCSGHVLNPCSTPTMSFRDPFYSPRTGEANNEGMKSEEKATQKKLLLGLNSASKADVSRIKPVSRNISFVCASQQVSHLPEMKQAQTNRLSRSVSDSCILSQFYAGVSQNGDLSAINSFFHQSHYNGTCHDDKQLQTAATACVLRTQNSDCSETVSPMLLPVNSPPYTVLSVVCLERPLVIDLSTSAPPVPGTRTKT